jgi:hypothetical protein
MWAAGPGASSSHLVSRLLPFHDHNHLLTVANDLLLPPLTMVPLTARHATSLRANRRWIW